MSEQTNNNDNYAEELAVEACSVIWQRFAPADDILDATHRWTTEELSTAIYKHSGMIIPIDTLFQVLKETGYRYVIDDTVFNAKYVWLMKLK